jgi:hypothetical protein
MFGDAAAAMLVVSRPRTQTTEGTMDRNQAFALLCRAGFSIERVGGDQWKIGLTFPEAHGTPLAGEIHDERWIIGFAERFYHAYQESVIRKAAALVRAALEPDAEEIRRN